MASSVAWSAVVRRRLLVSSLAAALVVGVGVGYLLGRDDGAGGVDATLDEPGVVQDQTIGTNRPLDGDPLPDVEVRDADGNAIPLRSLIGQPLVINVWYSTCIPCKDELPAFAEVHGELGDDVRFVGVNPRDRGDTGDRFAHDLGVRYELLSDPDGLLLVEAGIAIFPSTLFVSPDGTIVKLHAGAMNADTLRSIVHDELLS